MAHRYHDHLVGCGKGVRDTVDGIEKCPPEGRKMRPRGVKFRPPGGPKWLSGGLWRPPGASWGSGGRSWRKRVALVFFETAQKVFFGLLGSILGTSWRLLGRFWVLSPPPGGGPGRLREVNFWRFCETCTPRGEKDRKTLFLMHFGCRV